MHARTGCRTATDEPSPPRWPDEPPRRYLARAHRGGSGGADRTARLGAVVLGFVMATAMLAPVRAQVAVSAYVDKTVVDVGETLLFTVEITGEEPEGALLPPTTSSNLALLSRSPVLRERTQFGAQIQTRVSWRYQGQQTGVGRIAPMQLRIGGRSFSTDAIPIDVVAGRPASRPAPLTRSDPAPSDRRDLVIRAEPRQTSAVVGEQVVVDYVLYFDASRVAPRQAIATGTWDAPGFWREEMDVPTRETYPRAATLGGRAMQAVTVRRLALFPARAGNLELAPMDYEIEVQEARADDPFAPFFRPFSTRRMDREATAAATSIEVRPLPAGAPPSFTGAVGAFELSAQMETGEVEPGEPVRLALTVRGTGNAATLEAPEIAALDGVDAYAPDSDRRVDRDRVPLRSARTFTYTFVPQGTSVEIPEIEWSYFDPDANEYVTLREGPFPITVVGGTGPAPVAAARTSSRWQRSGGPATGGLWAVLLVGVALPAVAGLGLVAARRGRRHLAERRRPAPTDPLASVETPRDTARAAEAVLRRAVSSRLGTEAEGLARADLVARVAENVDAETASVLDRLLGAADRTRFAGSPLPTAFREDTRALADALAR
ncbi:MAG: BatD family protein [Bacteroidota bacterium]